MMKKRSMRWMDLKKMHKAYNKMTNVVEEFFANYDPFSENAPTPEKSNCMECGTDVTDGINGWVVFLIEENQTECLCNYCYTERVDELNDDVPDFDLEHVNASNDEYDPFE
jgi:hypothetical protein